MARTIGFIVAGLTMLMAAAFLMIAHRTPLYFDAPREEALLAG